MKTKRIYFDRVSLLLVYCSLLSVGNLYAQEANATVEPGMTRICDGSGCSDRPITSATFDTPANAPSAPSSRVQNLINLAETNPKAAYDLGLRYFRGDGVPRDSYAALKWMRSAGDRGLVSAQLALGQFYLSGLEEMGSDPTEAEAWLSRAAAGGSAEAKNLLVQANAAKKNERQYYEWQQRERQTWYIFWHRSLHYFWYWHGSAWICQQCY